MTYSAEVLADSPLFYGRMGEASGTTMTDSSGNGHNGTYVTGITLAQAGLLAGDSDTCADFSSGEANVAGAAWMSSPTAVTVEAIIRPRTVSAGSYNFIAVRDDSNGTGNLWWVVLKGTKLTALCRGVEFSGATTILPNTTYHIVFTYDGTTAKLYVNGSLDGSAALSGAMSTVAQNMFIGRWGNAGFPLYFDGKIDEFAYYGSALSSGRISAHYAAATTVTTAAAGTGALSLSGSGAAGISTAGTGALTLAGSGTAQAPTTGAGALALAATGAIDFQPAAGSGALSLAGAGAGGVGVAGTGALTLAGSGTAVGSTGASGTGSLELSAAGSATLAASGTASLTFGAIGTAFALFVTDLTNAMNGRRRRGRGTATVGRAVAPLPPGRTYGVRYDKAIALPTPDMDDGRPT